MPAHQNADSSLTYEDRVLGCIRAGAVGDALGAPIEFMSSIEIARRFGPEGPSDYAADPTSGLKGVVTDDTQMTLFTLEGLVRAHVRSRTTGETDVTATVHRAYLRWLYTQGDQVPRALVNGELITKPALHEQRAPGNTCLSALRATAHGEPIGTIEQPINNSKGCGAVMRAAPVALWPNVTSTEIFRLAAETGALTHGHPSGYLSAGTFAVIIQRLLHGDSLAAALDRAVAELTWWPRHEEQLNALHEARELAAEGRPSPQAIETRLGGGWVGEEALAIGVCTALCATDLHDGLRLAINHSGDSDSTGSICGNILGAIYGQYAIPQRLDDHLDGVGTAAFYLTHAALQEFGDSPPGTSSWLARFPPD